MSRSVWTKSSSPHSTGAASRLDRQTGKQVWSVQLTDLQGNVQLRFPCTSDRSLTVLGFRFSGRRDRELGKIYGVDPTGRKGIVGV